MYAGPDHEGAGRGRRTWRRLGPVLAAGLGALGVLAASVPAASGAAAPPGDATAPYYLALGGSASVGVQPSATSPRGAPTDRGYANDLVAAEQSRWPGLRLAQLGCPGETSAGFLDGVDHCHYAQGSQLAAAIDFLRAHRQTVLVTVDLGFNDLLPCLHGHGTDSQGCEARALDDLARQLTRIVGDLRAAGPPSMEIIGVGHYDPYLADQRGSTGRRAFALASVGIIDRLNADLRGAYSAAGVPMADVAAAFGMASAHPGADGATTVESAAVDQTCQLTWMCAAPPLGPNPHPDDAGYQVMAKAIALLVPQPTGGS